jgi:hypothetical protein
LLAKLLSYGIQGAGANWFISYLTDARQTVEMKSYNDAKRYSLEW